MLSDYLERILGHLVMGDCELEERLPGFKNQIKSNLRESRILTAQRYSLLAFNIVIWILLS